MLAGVALGVVASSRSMGPSELGRGAGAGFFGGGLAGVVARGATGRSQSSSIVCWMGGER